MFFFTKLKRKYAQDRLIEEYLYQSVCQELKSNYVREGLWAKAQMNSGGDLNLQKSLYIKYRKQILKDELKQTKDLLQKTLEALENHLQRDIDGDGITEK